MGLEFRFRGENGKLKATADEKRLLNQGGKA
jgi:hypothetical protein